MVIAGKLWNKYLNNRNENNYVDYKMAKEVERKKGSKSVLAEFGVNGSE